MTWAPWFSWRPVKMLGGRWAFLRYVERRWNNDLNWWGDASGYAGTDGGFEYRQPLADRAPALAAPDHAAPSRAAHTMTLKARTLALVAEHGRLTAREVAEELGITVSHARAVVSNLHGKGLRIAEYRRDSDGGRLYPRPVYALGKGPDVKPPGRLSDAEYNRRYRARTRGLVGSVFALAGNNAHRRVGTLGRGLT